MTGVDYKNPSKRIADVFYEWLKDEVNSSGTDRNKFLDEHETAVEGLKSGWGSPHNYIARKLESHLDRLPIWFEGFRLDSDDDFQAARVAFAGLMQVSGCYRDQCYVQAQDAEDYIQRRQMAIGIGHDMAVKMQLSYILPASGNFNRALIDPDTLGKSMQAVSGLGERAVKILASRVENGEDLKQESSPSVTQMKYAQLEWLKFATESVVLMAKQRKGFLSAVPLLEPKSISADPPPKVVYPFQ